MNTITILDGSGTQSTPLLIHADWAPERRSRNIVHDLLDGGIGVALMGSRPPSGELRLYFDTETDAAGCVDLHAPAAAFTLTTDEADTANMTYIVADAGRCAYRLDVQSGLWVATVEFQEVTG